MSPTNKSIGCALTTEGESNVSGRAGVIRGAQPGPHQANPRKSQWLPGWLRVTVTGNPPEAQEVSHFPRQPQGNYVVDGAIGTHLLGTDPIVDQKVKMVQRNRNNFSVPIAGKRGGSSTRRQVVPPR